MGLVTSIHNFVEELMREWRRAQVSAVVGIVSSIIITVIAIIEIREYGVRLLKARPIDFVLIVFSMIGGVLVLISHLMLYTLYKKWERRFKLLKEKEEALLK